MKDAAVKVAEMVAEMKDKAGEEGGRPPQLFSARLLIVRGAARRPVTVPLGVRP